MKAPSSGILGVLERLTQLGTLLRGSADLSDVQAAVSTLVGEALRADLIFQINGEERLLWFTRSDLHSVSVELMTDAVYLPFSLSCFGGVECLAIRCGLDRSWHEEDRSLLLTLNQLLKQIETLWEQQHTVEALERQLHLALNTAPLLLWTADSDGIVRQAAGRGLAALRLQPSQVEGRSIHDLLSQTPKVPELVRRAQQGETLNDLVQVGPRTFESWYLPLPSSDQPGSVLGIGYDVTELLESRQSALTAQRQAELLLRLSKVLDDQQTLSHSAQDILSLLVTHFGGGWAALWAHVPGWFRLLVTHGEVPPVLQAFQERGIPDSDQYGQALLAGQAVFLAGEQLPGVVQSLGLRAAAMLPVTLDAIMGARILTVYRSNPPAWTDADRDLLFAAARTVQVAHRRLESLQRLQTEAATDPLTGLGNRRAFERALRESLQAGPCLLISTDLDGLKRVNDTEGHPRGDALLRAFASALRATFQPGGLVFRLGGDEFMVIVPGVPAVAWALGGVVRAARSVQQAGFSGASASAGVARAPDEAQTVGDLIELSDARMYDMKAARRRS